MNRAQRRASKANGRRMMKAGFDAWEDITDSLPYRLPHLRPMTGLLKFFKNSVYTVQIFQKDCAWGAVMHLMVRRNDEGPIRSWSDMQRIKNELVGSERVGVEVYPPESEVVDQANMYHLWVLPEEMRLPFKLGGTPRAVGGAS